ncbi:MAG: hypothetical protein ACI87E_002429, partial [Mariniblastus sp.]
MVEIDFWKWSISTNRHAARELDRTLGKHCNLKAFHRAKCQATHTSNTPTGDSFLQTKCQHTARKRLNPTSPQR